MDLKVRISSNSFVDGIKQNLRPIGNFELNGIIIEVVEPSIVDLIDSKHDMAYINSMEGYDLSSDTDIGRLQWNILELETLISIYEGILSIYDLENVVEKTNDEKFVKNVIRKMKEVLSSSRIKIEELQILHGAVAV